MSNKLKLLSPLLVLYWFVGISEFVFGVGVIGLKKFYDFLNEQVDVPLNECTVHGEIEC